MLVWHLADQHRHDIRIEAAVAKIFCSEHAIRFVRDAQIIFGGMGYETAESKQQRGEPAFGVEQLVRDAEMYRIGEGATDILRPFVVREALSRHVDRSKAFYADGSAMPERLRQAWKLGMFYLPWYFRQFLSRRLPNRREFTHPKVLPLLRYVERTSRRLARETLYAMARFQAAFRDEQRLQAHIEGIGEDLLAITAAALDAERQTRLEGYTTVWELADSFCAGAMQRIERRFTELPRREDAVAAQVGVQALKGYYPTLSDGIIRRRLDDYLPKDRNS